MEIVGRADKPWDAAFIFHFYSSEGDQAVAERLQKLIARKAGSGGTFGKQVSAGKRGAPCLISGRFLERKECYELFEAWNAPEGEMHWMCYTPNHGIATVRDGVLDWLALICFQCANAGISGSSALQAGPSPNRNLPEGPLLHDHLIGLLPERPFPIRM
ncbi:hypothetical protein KZZ07_24635 [Mameliella sp. CS4]|uniref:hypothetical protein n=1 Tax=Mameliella sp. CS4 TaxID=2862329 RepID=UPI001C5F55EE|nr:hypothetical protein [Mameliella sp. CS4]MBW4985732.1 hypothetical protein [Mameliella sp. CS4]